MSNITLKKCENHEEHELFRQVVNEHHSYIKHTRTPTRRINWLVYEQPTNNLIGAIGINSATLNLSARDSMLECSNEEKLKVLKNFGNNYRFALIKENITIKNAGSQVLKAFRDEAKKEWKSKYGDDLLGIETFVKPPWNGTVYKADNWEQLGMTSGWTGSRLPLTLIPKRFHKQYLKEFKLKHNTNRKVSFEKTDKKIIFFKSMVDDLQVKVQDILKKL